MIKVLFISDREPKIKEYKDIFLKNIFDFLVYTNEAIILDLMKINAPDIIILDAETASYEIKSLIKKIKSYSENSILILLTSDDSHIKDLEKHISAIITDNMSANMILSTVNMNLRTKNSLEMLSDTNKDLADSLYRLNALYDTSSKFAGTLDKEKLINYMIEGMDKSLSFSLTCTLSFCTGNEPVLLLNSLYEISDELLSAIKLRIVLNYNSIFENKDLPYRIEAENLKVIKNVKYPANRFTFNLFRYDNMFASISLGDDFFGCIEIFKDAPFSNEDSTCFQTLAQQVALPLKSASLYQEIIETNLKLEKLERLKSEFISIVSHELRTPLTSIKNSLDILLSGRCGELDKSADKFISMARRNVQRLSGIINDLLDLSKIEAGKMDFHFSDINVQTVIEYVKSTLNEIANSKNLTLLTEESENLPQIYADSQRLEQVLTNLVSNAIKFTTEDKNITIKSSLINAKNINVPECFENEASKLSGDYILVTVEDEGIGLAEKDFMQAFDKFGQIENSLSRKVGGSGLGLPIARQLLDAHDGMVWCESELGKGSKFKFVIPVSNEKTKYSVNHKQLLQKAKAENTTLATISLKGSNTLINKIISDENIINKKYLTNSLIEKENKDSLFVFDIPDGDQFSAEFIKKQIDNYVKNEDEIKYSCEIAP